MSQGRMEGYEGNKFSIKRKSNITYILKMK